MDKIVASSATFSWLYSPKKHVRRYEARHGAGKKSAHKEDMMSNQITELVLMIDRSSSMSGKEKAIIEGFNGILADHHNASHKVEKNKSKKSRRHDVPKDSDYFHFRLTPPAPLSEIQPDAKTLVTTVLFDHTYEMIHYRRPIHHIKPMTEEDYKTRGCTALYDAIGQTIHHIVNGHRHDLSDERPSKVLFVIMTDGMENASEHYNSKDIKHLIRTETEKYHWEFMFLGANIDAAESAEDIGIDASCAAQFDADCAEDVACCMDGMRALFMRCCEAPDTPLAEQMNDDWRGELRRNRKK